MNEILKKFRKKIFKVVKKTGLHEPNLSIRYFCNLEAGSPRIPAK